MSRERNEPCPCGSGKKYKKCCGALRPEQDPVALHRAGAYTGDIGRRRKQFCLDYTLYKKDVISHGEQLVRAQVAAAGESISCTKGCGHCCVVYVFANLQEAECITHYLYQHDDVMLHFLSAYDVWQKSLGLSYSKLPRLERLIAKNLVGALSPQEQAQFEADTNSFAACQAPCPFLQDNACSIYEVRPFVCASAVAVTPAEKCVFDASGKSEAKYHRFSFRLESDMPYFVKPRNPVLFGCMPELVHRIVTEGYSFLSTIEGLEGLHR